MRVHVVDNGGQWTHREWRVLREIGADAHIVENTKDWEDIMDCDALVLSGGAPRIGKESIKLGWTGEYIDRAYVPILGICVGCQYIAIHFGGSAGPADIPEYGKTTIVIDDSDELFATLPKEMVVWESHNDEIKEPGKGIQVLAHSENCKVQAIKHETRPIYGVQFHPEVEHTQYGKEIFENFLKLARI